MNQDPARLTDQTAVFRLFVALPIAPWLVRSLDRLQARLRGLPGGSGVRWTRPEQMHLTLRFLGNVRVEQVREVARRVEQACHGMGAFRLQLRGLGWFPGTGRPRVIWVGIDGAREALQGMRTSVAEALSGLGDEEEARSFQPHLTIGRVRLDRREGGHVREMLAGIAPVELGEWLVGEVVVMRSELRPDGARYTRLATVTLPVGVRGLARGQG
jgi:RNA 2',3'-cyclic 3'-phosphodiesterase